jgi:hypothetical protein
MTTVVEIGRLTPTSSRNGLKISTSLQYLIRLPSLICGFSTNDPTISSIIPRTPWELRVSSISAEPATELELHRATAAYNGLIPTNERYGRVTLLRTDKHSRGVVISTFSSAILDYTGLYLLLQIHHRLEEPSTRRVFSFGRRISLPFAIEVQLLIF